MEIIRLDGLTRKFGEFTAVDSISFSVKEGEIFGFLGPNGAGKTTTLSMLSTILKPTSGKAFVNGFDITKDKDHVRSSIGIVFQDQSLDDELTACENLVFHGVMYDVDSKMRKERISELLKLVDLHKRRKDRVKTFSGGMRRRLEIARGLLHHPKVLFLDEPTLGLDPQTRTHIWNYIEKLNKKEKITIILTTHYMEEADKLCDRIAIIDKGKVLALDSPEKLKLTVGGDVVSFKSKDSSKLSDEFSKLEEIGSVKKHDSTVNVTVEKSEKKLPFLLKIADKAGVEVESISIHKPTLEDAFLQFTGKTIREEEGSFKDAMRLNRRLWRR